jgi:hypothetical protein
MFESKQISEFLKFNFHSMNKTYHDSLVALCVFIIVAFSLLYHFQLKVAKFARLFHA